LKGNIRVFCRVRPPVGEEKSDPNILSHINFNEGDDKEISLVQSSESASGSKTVSKAFPFTFDKVFKPSSTQGEVFDEISQLVQSALDGYKVCIFAYGQTGSGKTYTMEGKRSLFYLFIYLFLFLVLKWFLLFNFQVRQSASTRMQSLE
jgi:kinesin family protein C1